MQQACQRTYTHTTWSSTPATNRAHNAQSGLDLPKAPFLLPWQSHPHEPAKPPHCAAQEQPCQLTSPLYHAGIDAAGLPEDLDAHHLIVCSMHFSLSDPTQAKGDAFASAFTPFLADQAVLLYRD